MSRTTLDHSSIEKAFAAVHSSDREASYLSTVSQPFHVIYGGADLYSAATYDKLSQIALKSFTTYAATLDEFKAIFGIEEKIAETVFEKINTRLRTRPIDDLRIDFEDGFGIRPDAEEDEHAIRTAIETAKALDAGELPQFFGIRIKSFSPATFNRGVRTLDLYLTKLLDSSRRLPNNFVVTLPKVESPNETKILADILDEIEAAYDLENGTINIEIMIETPQALMNDEGICPLALIVDAARGRCRGAHFGAYDYMASLGIASSSQELTHQACDNARNIMQLSLGRHDIWLSDGATNQMPIGPHRGTDLSADDVAANKKSVAAGWVKHYINCKHSLANGFQQGWDLHPAQIPARLAAVYEYYLIDLERSADRLRKFIDNATKASLLGVAFDDAATGQGLLNYFIGAVNCGAIGSDDVPGLIGVCFEDIESRSFASIIDLK